MMKLIHTDWEKAPSKIKMLENEVEKIERKYGQLVKLAKSRRLPLDKAVELSVTAGKKYINASNGLQIP